MNNFTTTETLIRFYYGECDLFENMETENLLMEDVATNNMYSDLAEELQSLIMVTMEAPSKAINNILAYSKNQ